MTSEQMDIVARNSLSLLATLRQNAVALVDAFDFTDHSLGSALGCFDGNVYENLYRWAKCAPLNKTEVCEVDLYKIDEHI